MKKTFKYILIFVIIIATMFALFACKDNDEDGVEYFDVELNVISFNIRSYQPIVPLADSWDYRKDSQIAQIRSLDPDIIGLQEVKIMQRQFLFENTDSLINDYTFIGKPEADGFAILTAGGNYILYKRERFELLDVKVYWLSETPEVSSKGWDAANLRTAVFGKFLDLETNRIFLVCNTHLDHKGQTARENGIKMILETIKEYNLPTILMGDFNVVKTNIVYQHASELLNDTRGVATVSTGDVTFHNYGTRTTEHTIDFLFTSKDKFEVSEYKVINERFNEIYTSDHFPVQIKLTQKDN